MTQYVCLNLMKREAFNHGKMKQLCRRLDIPLWQAVGLLESIWNLTAKECPRGDIGRLSDEYICLAMDYRGDETVLMEGLIHARWIDRQETARLVIHDWYDHADDAVHRKLARAHLFFVTGEAPRLTRLAGRERQEAEQFYATHLQSAGPSFPQEGPVLWQESTEKCAQNINPGVPSAPKTPKSAPYLSPARALYPPNPPLNAGGNGRKLTRAERKEAAYRSIVRQREIETRQRWEAITMENHPPLNVNGEPISEAEWLEDKRIATEWLSSHPIGKNE